MGIKYINKQLFLVLIISFSINNITANNIVYFSDSLNISDSTSYIYINSSNSTYQLITQKKNIVVKNYILLDKYNSGINISSFYYSDSFHKKELLKFIFTKKVGFTRTDSSIFFISYKKGIDVSSFYYNKWKKILENDKIDSCKFINDFYRNIDISSYIFLNNKNTKKPQISFKQRLIDKNYNENNMKYNDLSSYYYFLSNNFVPHNNKLIYSKSIINYAKLNSIKLNIDSIDISSYCYFVSNLKDTVGFVLSKVKPDYAHDYTKIIINSEEILSDNIKNHKQTKAKKTDKIFSSSTDLIVGILIVSIILFSFVKLFYNKYIPQFFSSSIYYNESKKLLNERNILLVRASLVLYLVFILNIALLLFEIYKYYGLDKFKLNIVTEYFISSGIIFAIYTFKSVIIRLFGFVLRIKHIVEEYLHTVSIYNIVLGIVLLPIVLAIPFIRESLREYVIILGILLVIISYILRVLRAFKIIFLKGISIIYLILYLCALEILPMVIIYRTIYLVF